MTDKNRQIQERCREAENQNQNHPLFGHSRLQNKARLPTVELGSKRGARNCSARCKQVRDKDASVFEPGHAPRLEGVS